MSSSPSSAALLKPEYIHLEAIQAELTKRTGNKLAGLFPSQGPLRRERYPKQIEFFKAGAVHKERAFIAGNRCGKTLAGAYETTLHLTGLYPDWWEGRRFACPIDAWAAGDTSLTTRDIIQQELLGRFGHFGTGMIPREALEGWTRKAGNVYGAVDTVLVKHVSGGTSVLGFKTYSEGRQSFQGTAKHLVWFDEEPGLEVYTEALMRTMVTPGDARGGLAFLTFTPLQGWSDVVTSFLEERDTRE